MTKIVGIEGMSDREIAQAVDKGARFVVFHYTISILVMTFRRPSSVHFIPAGKNAVVAGLPYTLLSLVAGWWGIPWGPIYTIGTLATNLSGGKDVTHAFDLGPQEVAEQAPPVRPVVQQA